MAKSILIVDDNALIRKALCGTFGLEEDFDVCGEQKTDATPSRRLSSCDPICIVSDLSMPVMNGLNAARVLKRLMPKVPLIVYSAFR
jgi:DNA-binding NarL/FixJ family response regulator